MNHPLRQGVQRWFHKMNVLEIGKCTHQLAIQLGCCLNNLKEHLSNNHCSPLSSHHQLTIPIKSLFTRLTEKWRFNRDMMKNASMQLCELLLKTNLIAKRHACSTIWHLLSFLVNHFESCVATWPLLSSAGTLLHWCIDCYEQKTIIGPTHRKWNKNFDNSFI